MAAAALLIAAVPAVASDELPDGGTALVQVHVPNEAAIVALAETFDVAEYKRVEADGTLTIAVDTTAPERAELRRMGLRIGDTIEDATSRAAAAAERDAQRAEDERAAAWAERGVPKSRAAVAPRGETVIQRVDRFTNYAGTFLYVEAHNKATVSTGPTSFSGPTLALSYAGADGVYSAATEVPRYIDIQTAPDTYMFHRLLVRLTDAAAKIPVSELTVRVASSSGSVDTGKAREWPGATLPPMAAGYQQGFFNRYQDPTENRAQLDKLAADFPNLVTAVNLPHLSPGYQRKAMGIVGLKTPYADQTSNQGSLGNVGDDPTQTAAIRATQALVVNTKAWGHEGGNTVSVELRTPAGPNAPLTVSVTGADIVVGLAGDAAGAPASKTADVIAAIRASAPASELVTVASYRGNDAQGIAQPTAKTLMKDYLNAPPHVQRGPFQQRVYRIGAVRDGSKVGVFFTCQTHAREWTTGLTCVETAERLVRNYATDPATKRLMDNVEVFIHANGNPDGGHLSMYDFAGQRRNMVNHCAFNDPVGRNQWGVDLNRNYTEYSRWDGPWVGASADCTVDSYSGPGEASEPETKNDMWIADQYPNIKFASNMHSFGGYFMWSPGAYMNDGKRTTSPAPNIGVEKYFFEAGEKILGRIKEFRGTVITPARTGPIADVIYSGAGSSADDHWYRKGIIGYGFETGADKFISTSEGTEQIPTGFQPPFGEAGPGQDPRLAHEGRGQAMEFASGNFGMIEAAYDYAMDTTPPRTSIEVSAPKTVGAPVHFKFNWDDEAGVIRYTTDGSTPTLASATYNAERPRGLGEVLTLAAPGVHEIKWFATDIKGNQSAVQTQRVQIGEQGSVGGTVPATLSLAITAGSFPPFVAGVARDYEATSTATVTSTAGNATLAVSEPGHLANGAFTLPEPLRVELAKTSWLAPTSSEDVGVTYKQMIKDTDPLRTGTYSRTLTFTLSTTNP
ncbi:chitobiase/beta-hexosaminidase C-terminal domain-containing protein [Solirubrobacter sp. CPCC 204708]|uniref:M14 family metallopeptidase n=1 Tax=Solirubrobacter deserti TaxID=2282478 RepID=A0ABT4RM89_9ACTN|nr:M14 family metallopeptidase [Solirubrobacter deserti]MBE2318005.1 chitobiase/beta-hexosaminidase C-terminal domain-containing protein [Solirubrobacter deserti]MDA0139684.1 M14 family metallopeptidase [Solirubrobacter deserti]